ncbi:HD domain-containing protein [Marinicauda salina]|uniref:HD domain-containing protein n=1 Tax=Marinicauda salina TaxID=2135793 RepID=UPI0011B26FDF|nr:hypothetical protein [Marinicauda salina]
MIGAYGGLGRRYHDRGHIAYLLGEIDRNANLISDIARLRFAAWFHDAVYVTWRKDNEARSARWAASALRSMGASDGFADRVNALIRATADHAGGGADADDDLFLDMDFSILGAPPERYDRYVRQVRLEYWWAPPWLFRPARKGFIERALARERIFLTDTYENRLGDQARENLRRELERL